jgi:ankyrin repeat protein
MKAAISLTLSSVHARMGWTARLGVVRSLYHLGADINHRNQVGQTALDLAKASDLTDIVNSLQWFGALDAMGGELGRLSG